MRLPSTVAPVRPLFRAVVRAVAPAAAGMAEAGWMRAEAVVDEALAERSASVRRQIVLFLRLLSVLALLRFGRTLPALDLTRSRRLLAGVQRCPLLLLRRGLWGVRTLAFMGYYAQESVQRGLGYAANREGWAAAGGGAGPWPGRGDSARGEPTTLTASGSPHEPPQGADG